MSQRVFKEAQLVRTALTLALLGLTWHVVEAALGFYLGYQLDSPVLRGFALDSAVEILAGVVLLLRLLGLPLSERLAGRLIALSFFLIAGWIVFDSLESFLAPPVSPSGGEAALAVALGVLVILTMYPLAFFKERVARALHSQAVRSEGRQTLLCGHMAWLLLLGVIGPLLGASFLSGAAALLIAALAVMEGCRAWSGQACSCAFHAKGVDYQELKPLTRAWADHLSPSGRAIFSLRWPLTLTLLLLGVLCSGGGLWLVVWGLSLLGIFSLWLPMLVIRSRIEGELLAELPA